MNYWTSSEIWFEFTRKQANLEKWCKIWLGFRQGLFDICYISNDKMILNEEITTIYFLIINTTNQNQETPNVSCDNSTGDTILHAAAFLGEAKLVSALAHYRPVGMEVDVKNNKGI